MPIKQIDYGTKEYDQMVGLRYEILRKPLKLSFEKDELEKEKNDILIAAFEEDKILGCCLLKKNRRQHRQASPNGCGKQLTGQRHRSKYDVFC